MPVMFEFGTNTFDNEVNNRHYTITNLKKRFDVGMLSQNYQCIIALNSNKRGSHRRDTVINDTAVDQGDAELV